MTEREIEPVREHDETRRDAFTSRECKRLAVGAGRDRGDLGGNESALGRNLGPHRVHERVVRKSALGIGPASPPPTIATSVFRMSGIKAASGRTPSMRSNA